MLRRAVRIGAIVCMSSVVQAGVVVELVPDNPGPYFGGESLTVDVWLQSEEPSDVELRTVSFDFFETDSELTLDSAFDFDLSSVTSGAVYWESAELPHPTISFLPDILTPPGFLLVLPAIDPLHIGSVGVELPSTPGVYRMDILNAGQPDLGIGGAVFRLTTGTFWFARDGEITGGVFDFGVVPEPGTLSLLVLGSVAFMVRARRRRAEDRPAGRAATGRNPKMPAPIAAFIYTVGVCVATDGTATGEPVIMPSQKVGVVVDSGAVSTTIQSSQPVVVFSQIVAGPAAPWIRLHFGSVQLAGLASAGNDSFLRITSVADGAVQLLDSVVLTSWKNTSGYFNGDQVLLELLAYPNTGDNWVVVDEILVGVPGQVGGEGPEGSEGQECTVDDRVPSNDARTGRFLYYSSFFGQSSICTAFLFDNRPNCLLSAGHCCASIDFANEEYPPIVEFNVPLSNPDGTLNHPVPDDQYLIDEDSVQSESTAEGDTPGADWCYFGVFDNSGTGLSPLQTQGASYRLSDSVPNPDNSQLRITGHGNDVGVLRVTQQTDTGMYESLADTFGFGPVMGYGVYTVGGLSGAVVQHVCRDLVYGIHTHGGCGPLFNFMNFGTPIDYAPLQSALANPLGVCAEPRDCNGNGIDDACDINCGPPGGACDVPGCEGSADCSSNGIPDECEPDCNGNGLADRCDIDAGTSADVNDNYIPDECEALFVDQSATGANDGSSWADAYTDLQSALNDPNPCGVGLGKIWVAQGIYVPAVCQSACDAASPERDESFEVPGGAMLYGGFPAGGGDGSFQARSPTTYPTILSGDLNGDDGPGFANNDENSQHVVRTTFGSGVSGLDGFHVVGGNANGTGGDAVGAGIWLSGDSTVANCIVRGNSASNLGAGALANPGNHTIVNCLFTGNEAGNWGAGLYSSSATSVTVRNCTFSGNSGSSNGAGIAYSGTAPAVRNCVLWGNSVNGETDESAQIDGNPSIEYSCVQGWTGSLGGTGNIGSDPLYVDADGDDDLFGTADDDVRLSPGSPSIDAGKNYAGVPETTDLDGNPRRLDDPLIDDTGSGTAPIADMGAYEYYSDCNGNDIHDPFDPMDWDAEGDVDLADFAGFQVCFGDTTVACLAAFDRAGECDVIDTADYAVFAWQLTGPGGQGARSSTSGGSSEQELMDEPDVRLIVSSPADETTQVEAEPASGSVDTLIVERSDCWRGEGRALTLEVKRVGGGRAVSVLEPNTTYELHYQADFAGVRYYLLWAVGTSPDVSFTAVIPASSGPWANTGNFRAYDLIDPDEGPIPASDYPDGHYFYDLALDQGLGRIEGHMCNFTTGQAGELGLRVYLEWTGRSPCVPLIMEARASLPVR